jgi:hypothetical protein
MFLLSVFLTFYEGALEQI